MYMVYIVLFIANSTFWNNISKCQVTQHITYKIEQYAMIITKDMFLLGICIMSHDVEFCVREMINKMRATTYYAWFYAIGQFKT